MLSVEKYQSLIENELSFLNSNNDSLIQQILQHASIASLPKDTLIFDEGSTTNNLAVIISGKVRVYKLAESGREITIYRINKGESCILTISSILSNLTYPARAVVEEDVEALIVPSDIFKELVNKDEIWRNFTFGLMNTRFANVITVVEEVAFRRMDERILEFLVQKFNSNGNELNITHQEIAYELGTYREVVSRILKDFEKSGLIELSRNKINILNVDEIKKKLKN
ncbi:MAG: Crp/Fnr family transcriptional regulator [Ignavibacteriae bacterium]|nr:Crp/Fnr family transcriptional regulator [Ignavibacteriota bacterium]